MSKVVAPWTAEQVLMLQHWQEKAILHPFTCGRRDDHPILHGDKGMLVPTIRGWICQF